MTDIDVAAIERMAVSLRDERNQFRDECSKLADQVERLKATVGSLRERLFQVYVAAGEDTDGATSCPPPGCWTPDVPELALRAVSDLRHTSEVDYDALDVENQRLKADRRALDIAVTGLRELETTWANDADSFGDGDDLAADVIRESVRAVSALLQKVGNQR